MNTGKSKLNYLKYSYMTGFALVLFSLFVTAPGWSKSAPSKGPRTLEKPFHFKKPKRDLQLFEKKNHVVEGGKKVGQQ